VSADHLEIPPGFRESSCAGAAIAVPSLWAEEGACRFGSVGTQLDSLPVGAGSDRDQQRRDRCEQTKASHKRSFQFLDWME
jgi:hypothetical protein